MVAGGEVASLLGRPSRFGEALETLVVLRCGEAAAWTPIPVRAARVNGAALRPAEAVILTPLSMVGTGGATAARPLRGARGPRLAHDIASREDEEALQPAVVTDIGPTVREVGWATSPHVRLIQT